jgi:hypothetical protein
MIRINAVAALTPIKMDWFLQELKGAILLEAGLAVFWGKKLYPLHQTLKDRQEYVWHLLEQMVFEHAMSKWQLPTRLPTRRRKARRKAA